MRKFSFENIVHCKWTKTNFHMKGLLWDRRKATRKSPIISGNWKKKKKPCLPNQGNYLHRGPTLCFKLFTWGIGYNWSRRRHPLKWHKAIEEEKKLSTSTKIFCKNVWVVLSSFCVRRGQHFVGLFIAWTKRSFCRSLIDHTGYDWLNATSTLPN